MDEIQQANITLLNEMGVVFEKSYVINVESEMAAIKSIFEDEKMKMIFTKLLDLNSNQVKMITKVIEDPKQYSALISSIIELSKECNFPLKEFVKQNENDETRMKKLN